MILAASVTIPLFRDSVCRASASPPPSVSEGAVASAHLLTSNRLLVSTEGNDAGVFDTTGVLVVQLGRPGAKPGPACAEHQ